MYTRAYYRDKATTHSTKVIPHVQSTCPHVSKGKDRAVACCRRDFLPARTRSHSSHRVRLGSRTPLGLAPLRTGDTTGYGGEWQLPKRIFAWGARVPHRREMWLCIYRSLILGLRTYIPYDFRSTDIFMQLSHYTILITNCLSRVICIVCFSPYATFRV